MFKKLLQLKTLLVALLVMTGAGNAWADKVTYSLTPNNENTGTTATSYITTLTEFTYNGISWKMNQWNPSSLQIKTNQSSAASEFRFYNTSGFAGRITKVVIKFSALTVSDASKLMFLGGTSEVTATTGGTAGTWNSNTKTLTWTPGASDNFTFFAFYQNGKAASGTNKLATSDAIVVTYETGTSSKTATTTTIDDSNLTNSDVYKGTNAGYFTAIVKAGENPIVGATVAWASSDNDVATIADDGTVTLVAAGTTTITATYEGDDTYAGSTNTYEMTVTSSEPAPTFVKVTDVSALAVGDKITFVNEGNSNALGAFKSNNYGAVSVTISENTFKSNEVEILTLEEGQGEYAPQNESVWAFKKDNGKYLNAPGGINKNYMRESSDLNAESSAVIRVENGNAAVRFINFSLDDTQGRVIVRYNPNNGSPMFSCYASGQEDIQIYKIVTDATVSVSAAGYATFSSTTALDFTNVGDINAYTATVSGNDISFKRVKKVRANTGLLLRSVKGGAVSTSVPSLTDDAEDVRDNAFVAATEEIDHLPTTDEGFTNYILNKPSDGIIGFYQANNQRVGAGKAYLHVSSEQATTRAFIAFSFDDPETGIAQVETLPQQGVAYDLQGRRVNAPKGGLYIINGKKVIVK